MAEGIDERWPSKTQLEMLGQESRVGNRNDERCFPIWGRNNSNEQSSEAWLKYLKQIRGLKKKMKNSSKYRHIC